MNPTYSVISKYFGLDYIIGVNDCNVMMVEATGLDVSNIEPFTTLRQGSKILRNACGFRTYDDYFKSIKYKRVTEYEVTDGCILLSGIHCFIYYDNKLFGVSKNNKFEFMNPTIKELSKYRIYKKD